MALASALRSALKSRTTRASSLRSPRWSPRPRAPSTEPGSTAAEVGGAAEVARSESVWRNRTAFLGVGVVVVPNGGVGNTAISKSAPGAAQVQLLGTELQVCTKVGLVRDQTTQGHYCVGLEPPAWTTSRTQGRAGARVWRNIDFTPNVKLSFGAYADLDVEGALCIPDAGSLAYRLQALSGVRDAPHPDYTSPIESHSGKCGIN
eukprot:3663022-Prymnesium_polylepis.1